MNNDAGSTAYSFGHVLTMVRKNEITIQKAVDILDLSEQEVAKELHKQQQLANCLDMLDKKVITREIAARTVGVSIEELDGVMEHYSVKSLLVKRKADNIVSKKREPDLDNENSKLSARDLARIVGVSAPTIRAAYRAGIIGRQVEGKPTFTPLDIGRFRTYYEHRPKKAGRPLKLKPVNQEPDTAKVSSASDSEQERKDLNAIVHPVEARTLLDEINRSGPSYLVHKDGTTFAVVLDLSLYEKLVRLIIDLQIDLP